MFTVDSFFATAMWQRYGVTDLTVTASAKHTFTYQDERQQLVQVARPTLVFSYMNARVEKALPMGLRAEWITSPAGVATQRLYAVCTWTVADIG